jgi:hypothetical protein
MKRTPVYKGAAQWSRTAYLTLKDDVVEFDCSDEEYGPIRFPLQMLLDAIDSHMDKDRSDWDVTLTDGLDDLDS